MLFRELANYWQRLEKTSSRNQKAQILLNLIERVSLSEVKEVCYLSLGRLGPFYARREFNLAEKMLIRILASVFELSLQEVRRVFQRRGDLGLVAELLAPQRGTSDASLSVKEVYQELEEIARCEGKGSQEKKVHLFASLVQRLDPLSLRYLLRIPLGQLRLGFSAMTFLEALTFYLFGEKSKLPIVRKKYNICPDIGWLSFLAKKGGWSELEEIKVEINRPVLPALAERLGSAKEIVKKLGNFIVEPKIDGFRMQLHLRRIDDSKIDYRFFSRNLEDITLMFPEIKRMVEKLNLESAILDGEVVAYDPLTNNTLPFQQTMRRKRKYKIREQLEKLPVKLFVFDLLFLNGQELLEQPFSERRKLLEQIIPSSLELILVPQHYVSTVEDLKKLFDYYLQQGKEGLMCKKPDSFYQAGARNFNWVKYKRSTEGVGLSDTLDVLVLGYYAGRGQRAKIGLGAFLVGVWNEKNECFESLAKIGTGLTEAQWKEFKELAQKLIVPEKPRQYRVDKNLFCDVWLRPGLVVEIDADEITLSPLHCAGMDFIREIKQDSGVNGFSLRFPRLLRFREKQPQEVTSVEEIVKMYQEGRKRA